MYDIPTTIEVNNRQYAIRCRGDYRMVIDILTCMSDYDISDQERLYASLIIFYEDFNDIEDLAECEDLEELITQMYRFISCGDAHGGAQVPYKVIDWQSDSNLICAGINKVAQTEVRTIDYMHWWTFIGYYMEIGESTLATVVNIRTKIMKGKKLEKWEREYRISNPQYFSWDSRTAEQKAEDELLKEIWNSEQ